MEKLELSQNELKFLIAAFNHLVKTGGLSLGDLEMLFPIITKVREKIKAPEEPKVETPKATELAEQAKN